MVNEIAEVDQRIVEKLLELSGILLKETTLPGVGKALLVSAL